MSTPFLDRHQVEALLICLAVSVVWTPLVILAARGLAQNATVKSAQSIWLGALTICILPTLLAPGLAGLGLTLRTGAPTDMGIATEPAIAADSANAIDLSYSADAAADALSADMAVIDDTYSYTDEPAAPGYASTTATDDYVYTTDLAATPYQSGEFAWTVDALRNAAADASIVQDPVGLAALIYLYGGLLAFLIWASKSTGLWLVAARARPFEDDEVAAGLANWQQRLGVVGTPRLRRTDKVSSVCVFGIWRPIILIPNDIEARLTRNDIIMMCAHELAHVRRGDTRLFLATAMVRIVFWFNPAIRVVTAHVEQAAEEAADAMVLQRGVDRRAYASCFVECLRYASEKAARIPAFTPTFTPIDRRGRRRRLDAILTGGQSSSSPITTRIIAMVAASAAVTVAAGQAAMAVSPASIENRPEFLVALAEPAPLPEPAPEPEVVVEVVADPAPAPNPAPAAAPAPEAAPSLQDVLASHKEATHRLNDGELIWPATGLITLKHGERADVIDGKEHAGVDIAAPRGARVQAPRDGVVVNASEGGHYKTSWGKTITIDHGDGMKSRFAHLSKVNVKSGQMVLAGQTIGRVGSTGKSKGSHLHFEMICNGDPIDPLTSFTIANREVIREAVGGPAAPSLKSKRTAGMKDGDDPLDALAAYALEKPVQLAMAATATMWAGSDATPTLTLKSNGKGSMSMASAMLAQELERQIADETIQDASDRDRSSPAGAFARMQEELAAARMERKRALSDMKAKRALKKKYKDKKHADHTKYAEQQHKVAKDHADKARARRDAEREQRSAARQQRDAERHQRDAERHQREAARQQREAERAAAYAMRDAQRDANRAVREAGRQASTAMQNLRANPSALAEVQQEAIREAQIALNDIARSGILSAEDAMDVIEEIRDAFASSDLSEEMQTQFEDAFSDAKTAFAAEGRDYERSLADAKRRIEQQEAEIERLRMELEAAKNVQ